MIFVQVIFAEEMVFFKRKKPPGPIQSSCCRTIHKIRILLSYKDSKLSNYIWFTPCLENKWQKYFPCCVYLSLQFLVFTAMFFWAFLSVPLVDCSIDLQQESLNEGPRQFVHLAKQCPQSRDLFMMKLHHLTDRNVTCNDGTPAG